MPGAKRSRARRRAAAPLDQVRLDSATQRAQARADTRTAGRAGPTTTHVFPVSGVPVYLADQAKASLGVAGVSRRLTRPGASR